MAASQCGTCRPEVDALSEGGDLDRIGRRLEVAFVVDGALQQIASSERLTLRLVRARDAIATWAGTFDVETGELAAAAHQAAAEIAAAVGAQPVQP